MKERLKTKIEILGIPRSVTALLALLAILATIVFIFSNSAKSKTESNEQSDSFRGIVEAFIPEDTSLGKWVLDNIRKVAHFTEYGLLGIEAAVLVYVFAENRKKRISSGGVSIFFALTVAFFDETVQIFSKRGPSVSDMWIDIGGFFTYTVLTYLALELVIALTALIKRHTSVRKNGNERFRN